MPHRAAILFHPEAYSRANPKLMGRHAAGESFLQGFLRYSRADEFWLQVAKPDHARMFAALAQAMGRPERIRVATAAELGSLAAAGTLYLPGPDLGSHAWQRAWAGHAAYGLCGITHTTASAGVMDAVADLLTAPVQPWDALICTSTAVRDNVRRVLEAQADHLRSRLGKIREVLPQLPVIPLGIHAGDFVFSDEARQKARQAIGARSETLVVLFMGRLSFHAKAHPLPMYLALQAAGAGKDVLLLECGWHANEPIRDAYTQATTQVCPSIRVARLDGRNAAARATAWASADVFCSLSDNIQETFGLTPLEAMAAGLPVVVSDWDGYRDTVRDGVDGFRVPTLAPGPGLGGFLAARHALELDSYDRYCGLSCMHVAVDVDAATAAFKRLFGSAELRENLAAAGRRRALAEFDWSVVIPRYEALWEELTEIRRRDAASLPRPGHPWPARMDPFAAFAGYPTATLSPETLFRLADHSEIPRANALWRNLTMVSFAEHLWPTAEQSERVAAALEHGPKKAGELASLFPEDQRPLIFRSLAMMAKAGLLAFHAPGAALPEPQPVRGAPAIRSRQRTTKILFVHQNFPAQFKHLGPALAADPSTQVVAFTMNSYPGMHGIRAVRYRAERGNASSAHPWLRDLESKVIRGEAAFRNAMSLKREGFSPDVIVAHPGWGESLFLKDVWPEAVLGMYCEFFYHPSGADVGFDPEFLPTDEGDVCRLRLKNANNLLHFQFADAAIAPTHWQRSLFPEPFRSRITVIHDGIDTDAIAPAPGVRLTLNDNLTLTRDDEIVTFVNRNLEPYRGYHIFMRALPDILRARPRARVLIVGGDETSYGSNPPSGRKWRDIFLEEVRDRLDLGRVHFLGKLPYPQFLSLLQVSRVHVYLTYPFVLSWSLLEAMSVGCAIVASDTSPVREAIIHDETGRLVDFFDPDALTSAVCDVLESPDARHRLGQAARLFARRHYDLKTVCLPRQLEWVRSLRP